VCWAAVRHAFSDQDKAWLRLKWRPCSAVIANTQELRAKASKDSKSLNYRLLPPGFIDGGIHGNNTPEYSNIEWNFSRLEGGDRGCPLAGRNER